MTWHRVETPPPAPVRPAAAQPAPVAPPVPLPHATPVSSGYDARNRFVFTRGELVEFERWIAGAPRCDLPRHARRLASAARLGLVDDAGVRARRRAIEERAA